MNIHFPLEVAVVDDDQATLDLLTLYIGGLEKFKVVSFADPRVAVKEIEKQRISVVITDIRMKHMKGDDLIKATTRLEWAIDYIVVTSEDKLSVSSRCFRLGAVDILMKPIDKADLLLSLDRVADRYIRYHNYLKKVQKNSPEQESA